MPEEIGNFTGIKLGPATPNEDGERVHNIYNFDEIEKKVIVTTICYGSDGEIVDDSDTSEMVLGAESVSGWKPGCPYDTKDYRIDIKEI